MEEKKIWGIHTYDDLMFLNRNVIAIGWREMGDLSMLPDNRESFREKLNAVYPGSPKQRIANTMGMLYRFTYEIQIGDYVIYPSKFNREINIGQVTGVYTYSSNEKHYVHMRTVKWLKHLPRTAFSQGALSEIGSSLTLFSVKNYADEYLAALDKSFKKTEIASDDAEMVAQTTYDIIQGTNDYILKSLNKNLKGYDLEGFVASLLGAMGYRTKLSPRGGDRGIDIVAYKDELPPRILVQVKSGNDDIKEATIQSLKGAMHEGDYGLFITLANYTKNAQKYLDEHPIIRGINGAELVGLILQYYDGLSDQCKKVIPLQRVYVPDIKAEEIE